MGVTVAERSALLQAFYDEMVGSIFRILAKLDLSSVKQESEEAQVNLDHHTMNNRLKLKLKHDTVYSAVTAVSVTKFRCNSLS